MVCALLRRVLTRAFDCRHLYCLPTALPPNRSLALPPPPVLARARDLSFFISLSLSLSLSLSPLVLLSSYQALIILRRLARAQWEQELKLALSTAEHPQFRRVFRSTVAKPMGRLCRCSMQPGPHALRPGVCVREDGSDRAVDAQSWRTLSIGETVSCDLLAVVPTTKRAEISSRGYVDTLCVREEARAASSFESPSSRALPAATLSRKTMVSVFFIQAYDLILV